MAKRCIICNKGAHYRVKDTLDFYCEECADESFGDLSMLIKVEEEEAQRLKEFLKQKMEKVLEEDDNDEEVAVETSTAKKKKKQDDQQDN
ncbi:MAG: hypothetical protein AABX04_05725 [Nanoarchaeota archaeon]